MTWTFTKMHGAGNDFVVLDGLRQTLHLTPPRLQALAHRRFGVGADQILVVEAPAHPEAHFRYRIFNADGGEVEHCGNGARCFARFVHDQGLTHANPIRAEIATGLIELHLHDDGTVSVAMGSTTFEPAAVGFDPHGLEQRQEGADTLWHLPTEPASWISLVAISNPHAVQVVANVEDAPVGRVGPALEAHPRFAHRVNAGFMQVLDRHQIRLRVYERGAGETLACGTGACAAVVAGIRRGLLDSPVQVHTRGGLLTVAWDGRALTLSGPATTVYHGTIEPTLLDTLVPSVSQDNA